MAKLTNVRERVHQPYFDSLIRTAGYGGVNLNDQTDLFTVAGKGSGETNLKQGSVLPSDQSHVTLALRAFVWARPPVVRGPVVNDVLTSNGDISSSLVDTFFGPTGLGSGNAPADYHDVHRVYHQALEQLHWTYGTGEKPSIMNMATKYFPDGAGLSGDLGGVSDLIHWNNGDPTQQSILKLARAILLPPRQNVLCVANIYPLPDNNQQANIGSAQGTRNMNSLKDNLNAIDAMPKVIQFCFDGLFARDVQ
jgi:hypothetical protein